MNKGKDNKNTVENGNILIKKNKKLIIIVVLIALIGILCGIACSKYITTIQGQVSQKVAKMICNIEVTPSEKDKSIINPYCIVKVKNYDSDNSITETDVRYTIEVTPKGDFVMPEYYWQDSNGTIVSRSTVVIGNFKNQVKSEDEYKIVFLNSGVEDIMRVVEFNLIATQAD